MKSFAGILRLLAVLTALWWATPAGAALVLSGDVDHHGLRGHLSILDDPSGEMDLEGVAASGGFTDRPADAVERNYTTGAVWYRFTVLRPAGAPADWVLSIGEPFIDDIRVFVTGPDGSLGEHHLGRRFANHDLPMAARHHVVRLTLPAGEPATVHVRLASHDEIQFEAALWRPDALLFAEVRQSTLLGMFFTGLFFVVVTYLLFGVSLRDPPMIAYAVYVATFVLFGGSHSGVLPIVFPGMSGPLGTALTGLGVLGNVAAIIFMWDRVLELKRTYPRFHRAYMAAAAVALAGLLAIPSPWYVLLVQPTFIATMVVTLVSLGLAIALTRRGGGSGLVAWYIAAFVPFLLFSIAHAAEAFFPSRIDVIFVRKLGMAAMLGHIVILSVALARRVGEIQRQRIRVDADLAASRAAIGEHRNFVSMLSHQIRNPLAIITAAVDLMELKHRLSPDAAKIRRAALRIRDLTTDLLAESRLDEISGTLARRPVELGALLERLRDEQGDVAPRRITLHHRGGPATVSGDPTLLAVLFTNLLDNALKFSAAAAEITVTVTGDDGWVAVAVADQGPGIQPSEAGKVFEKYYRGLATSSQPGTGLGLYLVRRIAERHGGDVALKSTPGRGSEFTVRLPAAAPGASEPALTARGTA